jgi:hypothetical protein|tara:strand:+ start:3194 stop:3928 length:735 start_codon:yes stop_codon:yes gene_type:complete
MSDLKKHTTNLIVSNEDKVSSLYIASINREDKQIISIYINNKKDIAKFLIELSYYLGIKEPPTNTSLKLIIDFLADAYPTYTLQDIKLAFDLVLKGVISGVDIKHYQSFDIIYLTSILNEYKVYRNKIVLKIKNKEQYKKDVADGYIYDSKKGSENVNQKMADLVVSLYNQYLKKTRDDLLASPTIVVQYNMLYDILLKTKVIKGKSILNEDNDKFEYMCNYFSYAKQNKVDLKSSLYKKFGIN